MTIKTTDGREWPCRLTMGALRRYKQVTGTEAEAISGAADLAVLMWCCTVSASNADGVDFDMSLEDFTDRLDMGSAGAFGAALRGEKKTAAKAAV